MIMAAMFVLHYCGLFWRRKVLPWEIGSGGGGVHYLPKVIQLWVVELRFRFTVLSPMQSSASASAISTKGSPLPQGRMFVCLLLWMAPGFLFVVSARASFTKPFILLSPTASDVTPGAEEQGALLKTSCFSWVISQNHPWPLFSLCFYFSSRMCLL